MNLSHDMSFLSLITEASLVVQLVMLILILISLMSWATIFKKWVVLGNAQKQSRKFEEEFWSGGDLNGLYQRDANVRIGPLGCEPAEADLVFCKNSH